MKPIYKRISVFVMLFVFSSVAYYFGYTSVLTKYGSGNLHLPDSILKAFTSNWRAFTQSILVEPNATASVATAASSSKIVKAIRTATLTDQSRNSCKNCVPNNIPIIVENRDICKPHENLPIQLDLFIIIFTQFKSKTQRDTIRNTWLHHSRNNTSNVRYAFTFGRLPTDAENTALLKEAGIYKDIIQGDFKEGYRNLTFKTITMLGWVSRHCPHVKHVMKTDDDMWVNIPKLIETLKEKPLHKTVAGCCPLTAGPIRSKDSKWYVSYEEYSKDSYPGFCSGTGYVMDLYTAASIHNVSVYVPFLYLEDVYVSLCIEYLGNGFHLQPTRGFYNSRYQTNDLCEFRKSVLTSHYMSIKAIEDIWNAKC
ncbi:beta-1,3-galactosyltransferase 5 [Octopus bimaculoides]|nr:beta-1,3-galactosyltransferase 5 [Octopus bimaculoides]|eukprot:XP_014781049.1 PREDICTED: beta-1,3-galactosyltransferase 5-like [Octopus bimaculoides]